MENFLKSIGILASLIGIIDPIKDMLKDPKKEFHKHIINTIEAAVKLYEKSLNRSTEFSSIIPPDATEIIIENIFYAMNNDLPVTIDVICPQDDIPNHIRKQLFNAIYSGLQYSIMFCLRDFQSWIKQSNKEIIYYLTKIVNYQEQTEQIINSILEKSDSAKEQNSRSIKSKNKFHYTSKMTQFFGRDMELKKLKEFCLKDNDETTVCWWAVTGEGGIGKTRLVYELMNNMQELGWSVCIPRDHTYNTLVECSKNLPNNTLFVLDYSAMYMRDIGRWIEYVVKQNTYSIVRIILIERFGESLKNSHWVLLDEVFSTKNIIETLYESDFMVLKEIDEANLYKIMKSYAHIKSKSVSNEVLNKLYRVLVKVDPDLKRPLYCLFIIDAYLNNENPLYWEREDALNYVYTRELDSLRQHIVGVCNIEKNLITSCRNLIMTSTMTGGLCYPDEVKKYFPVEYNTINDACFKYSNDQLLEDIGLLDNSICYPLEPDIIGEFFVIQTLDGMNHERKKSYITSAWNKPKQMKEFTNRIYQDFSDILIKNNLVNLFNGIELPKDNTCVDSRLIENTIVENIIVPACYTYIDEYAFRGARQLSCISILSSTLTSIGVGAFFECEGLTSIKLPSITSKVISGLLFYRCYNLKEIKLPSDIEFIGTSSFRDCISLGAILLPDCLKVIDKWAFWGCTSLYCIDLPKSLTQIGEWAFEGCCNLKEIYIPDSVSKISYRAFLGCDNLRKVSLPKSLKELASDFQYYNIGHRSIKIEIRES